MFVVYFANSRALLVGYSNMISHLQLLHDCHMSTGPVFLVKVSKRQWGWEVCERDSGGGRCVKETVGVGGV